MKKTKGNQKYNEKRRKKPVKRESIAKEKKPNKSDGKSKKS